MATATKSGNGSTNVVSASKDRTGRPKKSGAKTFLKFPILPLELQLMIWTFAVPDEVDENGHRVVKFLIDRYNQKSVDLYEPGQPVKRDVTVMKIDPRKRGAVTTSSWVFDIGMTQACKQSREIYRTAYPNHFPVQQGVLHFNDATLFHFSDFRGWMIYGSLDRLIEGGNMPTSFQQIKKIAIDEKAFKTDTNFILFFLTAFRGVERVVRLTSLRGPDLELCQLYQDAVVKELLDFQDTKDEEYRIPHFSQLVKSKTV